MADPNFHIPTPRLYLSYFQPTLDTHCDFFVALNNSLEVVAANAGVLASTPDREAARQNLEDKVPLQLETGYGRHLVSLRPAMDAESEADDRPFSERLSNLRLIGTVSLGTRPYPEAPSVPDIGFAFLPAYWGKGYATEAARALMGYFEKERGLKEVLGYCMPDNEDSKKMFRRLEFEDRGVRLVKGIAGGSIATEGVRAMVWAKKGMGDDLSVYGL